MIDEVSFNVSDMLVWCKRVRRHAGEHVVRFELAAGQPSAVVFDREQWCEARTPFVDIPQLGNPNTHWFAPIDLLIDALSAASATPDAGGTLMVDHDENMLRFVGGGVTATLPLMAEQAWWSPPKRCDGKVGATLGQLAAVMGFARDESINLELAVVRCEHDAIVATDLQRIGWIETTTQLGPDDHVSVPAASVKLADTFLPPEAEVWMGDGAWSAEWRGDRFVGTPVMAQFPNWRSVVDHMVPDNPEAAGRRPFMVSRRDLGRALKDLSSKSFDPVVAVHLRFINNDTLVVSRRALEGGSVDIEMLLPEPFEGEDLTLTFQCAVLGASLRAWKSDAVMMWAGGPLEPTMWWSSDALKFIQTPVKELKQ